MPAGLVLVPMPRQWGASLVRGQNTKITPAAKPVPLRLARAGSVPNTGTSGLAARLVFQLPTSK